MKYQNEIIIELPRDRVVELFDSAENLPKWQPGLLSFEHISGEPGKVGSKSKLLYKMGRRTTEMIETITVNNLPDEFHGTYEAKGVHNIQENFFTEIEGGKTKWVSNSEFQFSGLMMNLVGRLAPSMFKKQTYKFMENFKNFAESQS